MGPARTRRIRGVREREPQAGGSFLGEGGPVRVATQGVGGLPPSRQSDRQGGACDRCDGVVAALGLPAPGRCGRGRPGAA